MSVKIRMKRFGRKGRPFYRICATDIRAPRDGRVIEELGYYDPTVMETDARVVLDGERIAYWLGVGAQPSPKVSVLIKKYGKDGSHLDAQQQALNRLAGRKAMAITQAQESARKAAAAEAKRREEEEATRKAEAEAAAQAAAAEAAAAEATTAESSATTEEASTAEPAAASDAATEAAPATEEKTEG